MALLYIAQAWARRRGRRLLALTVDHGLNPDSAAWTAFAGAAAKAAGADWRSLIWTGAKPTVGLPAAARAARHRLLAEAARDAGAAVILFAHTADDVMESDLMRADTPALGHLKTWSPSPVWPEGRAIFAFRPLLGVRRATLRNWLGAQGHPWLDDPANDDPRFARARARAALAAAPTTACLERFDDSELTRIAHTIKSAADGRLSLPRSVLADTTAAQRIAFHHPRLRLPVAPARLGAKRWIGCCSGCRAAHPLWRRWPAPGSKRTPPT